MASPSFPDSSWLSQIPLLLLWLPPAPYALTVPMAPPRSPCQAPPRRPPWPAGSAAPAPGASAPPRWRRRSPRRPTAPAPSAIRLQALTQRGIPARGVFYRGGGEKKTEKKTRRNDRFLWREFSHIHIHTNVNKSLYIYIYTYSQCVHLLVCGPNKQVWSRKSRAHESRHV